MTDIFHYPLITHFIQMFLRYVKYVKFITAIGFRLG